MIVSYAYDAVEYAGSNNYQAAVVITKTYDRETKESANVNVIFCLCPNMKIANQIVEAFDFDDTYFDMDDLKPDLTGHKTKITKEEANEETQT